ncbi:MAG: phosphoribosyltransferase family protein [Candidatus Woesearchaeota archaeon]
MTKNDKIFLDANEFFRLSFQLAKKVYDSGYIPDYLLIVSRGGFPIGITIHEFFRYKGFEIDHGSIKAVSYKTINNRDQNTRLYGIENIPFERNEKFLIIDDIFDTGRTIKKILSKLPDTVEKKIAVIYFKPTKNQTKITPDYYLHKTKKWIVYPHEICGLSDAEIKQKDPKLFNIINKI